MRVMGFVKTQFQRNQTVLFSFPLSSDCISVCMCTCIHTALERTVRTEHLALKFIHLRLAGIHLINSSVL